MALPAFFDDMGAAWCRQITHVCTEMSRAYVKVVEERLLNVAHILDRFHIVKLLNEAVDQVRRQEAAKLRRQGVTMLKGLKFAFLKRPEKLTEHQQAQLNPALNKRWLATVRACLWKEKFQLLWAYEHPWHALRYLRRWCKCAMRSRLAPIKKFVRAVRAHEDLMINWFTAKSSI